MSIFFIALDEAEQFKKSQLQYTQSLMQTYAQTFTKIIVMDDKEAATDLVNSLNYLPTIEQVYLFNDEQSAVFRYKAKQVIILIKPDKTLTSTEVFDDENDLLLLYMPAMLGKTQYGTIFIQVSLHALDDKQKQKFIELLIFIPFVMALSLLSAFVVQFFISLPVVKLKTSLTQITTDRDFSVQLHCTETNEIGELYQCVNEMLSTIQRGRLRLIESNDELEAKVIQRTAELSESFEQLVESEKLASLGSLVAGVAHEINTPLGVTITANSSVLDLTYVLEKTVTNEQLTKRFLNKYVSNVKESLLLAETSLERVRLLLSNFKDIAADQIIDDIRTVKLSRYIGEIMNSLSVEMKKAKVSYAIDVQTELEITTYPGAFAQVITNLVTNSINHGFEQQKNGVISIHLSMDGNKNHVIHYKDNGIGMTADVLKKIFQPFFTTKRGRGGTGLGMNIAYNIVKQKLNGDIKVQSVINEGASFIIVLPNQVLV